MATVSNTCVIVSGNPVLGLTIFGPFDSPQDATTWANNPERRQGDKHFWIAPLRIPLEFDQGGFADLKKR